MPPVCRKNAKGTSNRNNRSRSTAINSDTESLRRQCTERGLPNHGQKNALISRLLQHATTSPDQLNLSPPPLRIGWRILK